MNLGPRRRAKTDMPPARQCPVTPLPRPHLVPLIRVQMAKRGVRSVRALYQLLAPYDHRDASGHKGLLGSPDKQPGLRLSLMQLHALVNGEAKQINVDALCAIAAVLDCNIQDLFNIQSSASSLDDKDRP